MKKASFRLISLLIQDQVVEVLTQARLIAALILYQVPSQYVGR
jgi:hypothetical protein